MPTAIAASRSMPTPASRHTSAIAGASRSACSRPAASRIAASGSPLRPTATLTTSVAVSNARTCIR